MAQYEVPRFGPAIGTETMVIDHAKIYISEYLTSVRQRMGFRLSLLGGSKGPVERFARTICEDFCEHYRFGDVVRS